MSPVLAPLVLALVPTALRPDDPAVAILEGFAQTFLESHGMQDADPGATSLAQVLDGDHYARVDVGVLDIRYPLSYLADTRRAKEFQAAVLASLDMQASWCEWSSHEHPDYKQLTKSFAALRKWVKGWSPRALGGVDAGERDLLAALSPKDDVIEASNHVRDFMSTMRGVGPERDGKQRAVVLFAPDRKAFLELAGFAGWLGPNARAALWHDSMLQWTKFWSGDVQVVALEYPAWPFDARRPTVGAPMNEFEKSGLEQQVVEQVVQAMFWNYYGASDALFFESAIATNLAIEVCGESNVRTGSSVYKNSGNTTQPYSRFVPGGNPNGGTLPARSAAAGAIVEIPLWRTTKGRDHYVQPLRKAQVTAEKQFKKDRIKGKDKAAFFQLTSADNLKKHSVGAPFFGESSEGKEVPPDPFLDDYEDFFRAYRACFFDWMRTRGAGKATASEAKFAEMVHAVSTKGADASFHEAVEAVYGVPISASDGSQDSLEWQFLTWLSKQK